MSKLMITFICLICFSTSAAVRDLKAPPLEIKGAKIASEIQASRIADDSYFRKSMEMKIGMSATEGVREISIIKLGFDINGFAKKGEMLWEAREIELVNDELRAIIWVNPNTEKTYFVIGPWKSGESVSAVSRETKQGVSFEGIKIGYPDIEGQKKEMQKFSDVIESKSAIKKPDEILRQMSEQVPLDYIRTNLQELVKTTPVENQPNIKIFLDKIDEMRNLDDANASVFIKKAQEIRNADKLSVALFGLRTETQQAKAAEALASLKNPESVKLLTIRLFLAGGIYSGGTESKIYREQLRRSLVKALGSCTGFDCSDYDASSESATFEVVKRCQDWLEKNQK